MQPLYQPRPRHLLAQRALDHYDAPQHKTHASQNSTNRQDARSSVAICNRPRYRLGDPPTQGLYGNRQRKHLSPPAKIRRHRAKEDAKGHGKAEAKKGNHATGKNREPKMFVHTASPKSAQATYT